MVMRAFSVHFEDLNQTGAKTTMERSKEKHIKIVQRLQGGREDCLEHYVKL